MDVVVTRAERSDFLEIAALDRTGWAKNRNADYVADGEHVWRHWVDYALTFVARAPGGALLGFVITFPTIKPRYYYLHKLLLAEGCRGKGVGGALLEPVCMLFDKKAITVELTTDTNNMPMHNLIARFGFHEDRLEKGYYRENEDRLVFIRKPKTETAA
ncbi:GNAT family N-acetyltransferase [Woodsholea maritima]|uniref:GNAT family N-acetyltransferase n=1 Tax=Woodsholea maritima TaxID=240237 RepID=UPI00037722BD|nr:GNAT family N-acetyltransferase [Woodsholea maritima]